MSSDPLNFHIITDNSELKEEKVRCKSYEALSAILQKTKIHGPLFLNMSARSPARPESFVMLIANAENTPFVFTGTYKQATVMKLRTDERVLEKVVTRTTIPPLLPPPPSLTSRWPQPRS